VVSAEGCSDWQTLQARAGITFVPKCGRFVFVFRDQLRRLRPAVLLLVISVRGFIFVWNINPFSGANCQSFLMLRTAFLSSTSFWKRPDVSKDCSTFIFRVKQFMVWLLDPADVFVRKWISFGAVVQNTEHFQDEMSSQGCC